MIENSWSQSLVSCLIEHGNHMVDHFVHYYDFYSNILKKQGLL